MEVGDFIRVTDAAGALYVGATGRVTGFSPHGAFAFVDWDDPRIPPDTPLLLEAGDAAVVSVPAAGAFAAGLREAGIEAEVNTEREVLVDVAPLDPDGRGRIVFRLAGGVWIGRVFGGAELRTVAAESLVTLLKILGTAADES